MYCGVTGASTDGVIFKQMFKQLKNAFSHPVFVCYNPTLDLYAIHPCTHSDLAPSLFGDLRKTILLGDKDFLYKESLQYICDTGYYITTEAWNAAVKMEHLKFKEINSDEQMYNCFTESTTPDRLEQVVRLMHLRAKQIHTEDFFELSKPADFVTNDLTYKFIRKNKIACYIKKLL